VEQEGLRSAATLYSGWNGLWDGSLVCDVFRCVALIELLSEAACGVYSGNCADRNAHLSCRSSDFDFQPADFQINVPGRLPQITYGVYPVRKLFLFLVFA
jgi:hypothetical protein